MPAEGLFLRAYLPWGARISILSRAGENCGKLLYNFKITVFLESSALKLRRKFKDDVYSEENFGTNFSDSDSLLAKSEIVTILLLIATKDRTARVG